MRRNEDSVLVTRRYTPQISNSALLEKDGNWAIWGRYYRRLRPEQHNVTGSGPLVVVILWCIILTVPHHIWRLENRQPC